MAKLKVGFGCAKCGLEAVALVPVRGDPDEMTVVEWFDNVLTIALVREHQLRSPYCVPDKGFSNVMIPVNKDPDGNITGWVGQAVAPELG